MRYPLISVIVPIYKVEEFLSRCVDSIINQTYQNLEIFLVDDGSPDNCGKICEDYASRDSRIKLIHKINGGLSDARNVAINIATGEYITFIDSDDYVSLDYIETLIKLINKGAEIAVSGFKHCYEFTPIQTSSLMTQVEDKIYPSCEATKLMFYQMIENSAWGKLYKRNLFNNIRYPKVIYEDIPVTYKLMLKAENIAITNKITYFYLIRKDSILCSTFNLKKLEIIEITDNILKDIRENYPTLLKAAKCRCINALFFVLLQTPQKSKYEKILIKKIKKLRFEVLFDRNSRLKTKIGLLLSYLGPIAVRGVFHFINRRKF